VAAGSNPMKVIFITPYGQNYDWTGLSGWKKLAGKNHCWIAGVGTNLCHTVKIISSSKLSKIKRRLRIQQGLLTAFFLLPTLFKKGTGLTVYAVYIKKALAKFLVIFKQKRPR
jgi:hypothetical protein